MAKKVIAQIFERRFEGLSCADFHETWVGFRSCHGESAKKFSSKNSYKYRNASSFRGRYSFPNEPIPHFLRMRKKSKMIRRGIL